MIDVRPPCHSTCSVVFVGDPDHHISLIPISPVSCLKTVAHRSVSTLVTSAAQLDAAKDRPKVEILQVPNGCTSRSDARRRRWPCADARCPCYPRVTRQISNPRCLSPGLESGFMNGTRFQLQSLWIPRYKAPGKQRSRSSISSTNSGC